MLVLEVPVVLKMSEICGFIITNRCLIIFRSDSPVHIHKIYKYYSNIQFNDIMTIWLLNLNNYKK